MKALISTAILTSLLSVSVFANVEAGASAADAQANNSSNAYSFQKVLGYDGPGNDIGYLRTSLQSCEQSCETNSSCNAYYWVDNQCFLKSAPGGLQEKTFESGIFGIKSLQQ